jgi:hypothetical protein
MEPQSITSYRFFSLTRARDTIRGHYIGHSGGSGAPDSLHEHSLLAKSQCEVAPRHVSHSQSTTGRSEYTQGRHDARTEEKAMLKQPVESLIRCDWDLLKPSADVGSVLPPVAGHDIGVERSCSKSVVTTLEGGCSLGPPHLAGCLDGGRCQRTTPHLV